MTFDVRKPLGLLFLILGIILVGHGAMSDATQPARQSLGIDVNVLWGAIFAAFGALMLWLARKRV